MHNHPNHMRTLGCGEFVAVLNGVEFRTRHNDYSLVQSQDINESTGDKIRYNAAQNIPFPDVPPEVVSKQSVEEQVWNLVYPSSLLFPCLISITFLCKGFHVTKCYGLPSISRGCQALNVQGALNQLNHYIIMTSEVGFELTNCSLESKHFISVSSATPNNMYISYNIHIVFLTYILHHTFFIHIFLIIMGGVTLIVP